jgi:ATP/maltotriose-dependent transcriptional regulator MalT
MSILRTKLYRPKVPADHVHRTGLLKRLNQHLDRPLVLVSAPAGYGKSTLVSCWIDSCEQPGAWLSLDEGDDDVRQFLSYFVAALQTVFPEALNKTEALTHAPTLPSQSVLATTLINELERIDQSFFIVLDDIHCIRDKAVYELLNLMLRHPPPSMQMVLVGRRDPGLPIASLRAKGLLTELRMRELRFTVDEATSFLTAAMGQAVDESLTTELIKKAEGWVTGLRLAVLALHGRENPGSKLPLLTGTTRYVTDYLISEVLDHAPADIRHLLLRTSILNRFCAPLCSALCETNEPQASNEINGHKFIHWLCENNLFTISLDTENRWFRYHHLFQDLLKQQLRRKSNPAEIAGMHSRASRWLDEHGLIEETLQHALAAGDIEFAVSQIEQLRYALMNEEQWDRMEHLLKMFPDQVVETHPELLLTRAWILFHAHRLQGIGAALKAAEALIDTVKTDKDSVNRLRGEVHALMGYKLNTEADSKRAMPHLQKALQMLPPEHKLARGQATISYCIASQNLGNRTIIEEMKPTATVFDAGKKSAFHARRLAGYCFVHWIQGDLTGLLNTAGQLFHYSQQWSLQETMISARYFLGIAHYHRNDLSSAEQHLACVVDDIYLADAFIAIQSCFALSLASEGRGQPDKAREIVEKATHFALEGQGAYNILCAQAFKAEFDLLQGRTGPAQHWANQFNPALFRSLVWFYMPQLTQAKVRLARCTKESLQQVDDLLKQLNDFVVSIHNTRFRIDILAMQALLEHSRGNEAAALKKLAESLTLAEPGGFVRNFVDLGPSIAELLNRMQEQNVAAGYIEILLAAFRADEQVHETTASGHPNSVPHPPDRPPIASQPLVEPLSHRELDVLELLAQRLRNKEIAEKLFISPQTVKSHLRTIYQKLNAANRREAVSKACRLGIITRR